MNRRTEQSLSKRQNDDRSANTGNCESGEANRSRRECAVNKCEGGIEVPPGTQSTLSLEARPGSTLKVICVDMDEVIADVLNEQILRYNREFNDRLTAGELRGRWIWDLVPPSRVHALERHIQSDDFFSSVAVIPHAQRVLDRMRKRYEVYIATAVMEYPQSFAPKYEWLKRNFPFIPLSHIVYCGDKSILRGDFLIDDNPRQLRLFRGRGILYSSPANALVREFQRVNDWLDIEQLFIGS